MNISRTDTVSSLIQKLNDHGYFRNQFSYHPCHVLKISNKNWSRLHSHLIKNFHKKTCMICLIEYGPECHHIGTCFLNIPKQAMPLEPTCKQTMYKLSLCLKILLILIIAYDLQFFESISKFGINNLTQISKMFIILHQDIEKVYPTIPGWYVYTALRENVTYLFNLVCSVPFEYCPCSDQRSKTRTCQQHFQQHRWCYEKTSILDEDKKNVGMTCLCLCDQSAGNYLGNKKGKRKISKLKLVKWLSRKRHKMKLGEKFKLTQPELDMKKRKWLQRSLSMKKIDSQFSWNSLFCGLLDKSEMFDQPFQKANQYPDSNRSVVDLKSPIIVSGKSCLNSGTGSQLTLLKRNTATCKERISYATEDTNLVRHEDSLVSIKELDIRKGLCLEPLLGTMPSMESLCAPTYQGGTHPNIEDQGEFIHLRRWNDGSDSPNTTISGSSDQSFLSSSVTECESSSFENFDEVFPSRTQMISKESGFKDVHARENEPLPITVSADIGDISVSADIEDNSVSEDIENDLYCTHTEDNSCHELNDDWSPSVPDKDVTKKLLENSNDILILDQSECFNSRIIELDQPVEPSGHTDLEDEELLMGKAVATSSCQSTRVFNNENIYPLGKTYDALNTYSTSFKVPVFLLTIGSFQELKFACRNEVSMVHRMAPFEISDFLYKSVHPAGKIKLFSLTGEHMITNIERPDMRPYSLLSDHQFSRFGIDHQISRFGIEKCWRSLWMTLHSNYRKSGCFTVNSHSVKDNMSTLHLYIDKWKSSSNCNSAIENLICQKECNDFNRYQQALLHEDTDINTSHSFVGKQFSVTHNSKEHENYTENNKIHLGNTKISFDLDLKDLVSYLQEESSKSSFGKNECHRLKLLLSRLAVKEAVRSAEKKLGKARRERLKKKTKRKTLKVLIDEFIEMYDAGFPCKVENLSYKKLYKQIFDYLPFRHNNTLLVYPIHGLKQYFDVMSVPPSERPSHGETMRFEWVRVRSFWSFPSNVNVSPVSLARVGFYYTGKVAECKCFCCGAIYKDWKDGDDGYTIHRQISPTCPYLNGFESGNVPIHEEDRVRPRPQVAPVFSQSYTVEPAGAAAAIGDQNLSGIGPSQTERPSDNQGPNQNGDFTFKLPASEQAASTQQSKSPQGSGFFSPPPDLGQSSAQQQAEGGQENVAAPNPSSLLPPTGPPPGTQTSQSPTPPSSQPSAQLGQPSLGQGSQPRFQFNEGSNARTPSPGRTASNASRSSPVQTAPTASNADRTSPGQSATSASRSSPGQSASSSRTTGYSGPSTEPTAQPGTPAAQSTTRPPQAAGVVDSSRGRFDPLGINFERPKYPAYAVLTVRINTYTGWPAYLDQTPRNMALAGFFYAGYGDYTRCFFCGGGLRNWEAGDDPWVEHARWFPKCAFLRQNQGDRYVNVVQQRHQEAEATNRPLELPRQFSVLDQGAVASDIMSTVCVQTLREMGKDDGIIKEAIERWQREKRSGAPINSAELQATEIYEIILLIEEEREKSEQQRQQADLSRSGVRGNQMVSQATSMEASGGQDEVGLAEGGPSERFEGFDRVFDEWLTNKTKLTCKICQDQPVAIAFLPCGHLVCCLDCAPAMRKCPLCHHLVKGTIKTFFP